MLEYLYELCFGSGFVCGVFSGLLVFCAVNFVACQRVLNATGLFAVDYLGIFRSNNIFKSNVARIIFLIAARMIHLSPNEKILMVLHRHWIAIVWKFLLGIFLLILPILIAPYFPTAAATIGTSQLIIWFFVLIYLMAVTVIIFLFWIDYYLDIWIITSERIIDVEQKGLFNREVSEFMLDKVQDITLEVPNLMATFLRYGNLRIQTAGEREFSIMQIPNLYEAKNLIMDYAQKSNVRPQ